jgi:hypothetical protein
VRRLRGWICKEELMSARESTLVQIAGCLGWCIWRLAGVKLMKHARKWTNALMLPFSLSER